MQQLRSRSGGLGWRHLARLLSHQGVTGFVFWSPTLLHPREPVTPLEIVAFQFLAGMNECYFRRPGSRSVGLLRIRFGPSAEAPQLLGGGRGGGCRMFHNQTDR